jgi:hypothetical protein
MSTSSIQGIHKNDIEFYLEHTGCVKIKNATEYSAGNYSCYVEIRNNERKLIGNKTIEKLVPFSADDSSNIWISIYFHFIPIITFIKNYM